MADIIKFTINGVPFEIDPASTSLRGDSRLVEFIRNEANLKGTKVMCHEGGCGACLVTAVSKDPLSGLDVTRSVNSCLTPVLGCNGWAITTVEALGTKISGYSQIQQRLTEFGGTQCGWCSPGMVMNMHSLAQANQTLTAQQIEDNFDGNICRCTGYRPILEAFKSFAVDAPDEIKAKCVDIEETCITCPIRKENGKSIAGCKSQCRGQQQQQLPTAVNVNAVLPNGEEWVKATDLASAFVALNRFIADGRRYKIVGGMTGTGVFKSDGAFTGFLDVNDVTELRTTNIAPTTITLGGSNKINFAIDFLQSVSTQPGFEYAAGVSQHLKRVANVSVRNLATLSGNLMLKHAHPEFPSDLFVLFEAVGAKLNIASSTTDVQSVSVLDFLSLDMNGKIIVSLSLPQRTGCIFRSFKIAPRHQNAHAFVNAGFMFKVDESNNFKVLEQPTIVLGGISPTFHHATVTEYLLNGAELGNEATFQNAVATLKLEVNPDYIPPDASAEYRQKLALCLFYKAVLGILGNQISSPNISGAEDLPRLLTKAQQIFDIDTGDTPLYKPVTKLEAHSQISGEAVYVNDIPEIPGELYGAFVLTTEANATLGSVDASAALAIPGVYRFLQASDIPGVNDNMGIGGFGQIEPIFVESQISHAGQAIGLIVAADNGTAMRAARLVKVTYTNVQKPVITIEQAIEKAKKEGTYDQIFKPTLKNKRKSEAPPKAPAHTVSGEFHIGGQAHVHMEQHITICRPNERGLDVYCATQWTDQVQQVIASALNVPNNTLTLQVRRLGGAYGAKITRAAHTAVACALAAHILNKPVRLALTFENNMALVGKRFPFLINYEVGFNDLGKIEELKVVPVCDTGAFSNESTDWATSVMIQNCYQAVGWELTPASVNTNTPPNTWVRAPGSVKGVAIGEIIMDHIAFTLKRDPIEVRTVNLIQEGDEIVVPNPYDTFTGPNLIPELLLEMELSGDYRRRKAAVEEFNRGNRWHKRGLAMCPMRYPQNYGVRYGAFISIYHVDGTVAVGHAGIEMGQGLNTKVAQVVAHTLKIDLEKVEIKPSDNLIGANSDTTGGALTSELVSYAAMVAAQTLRDRIDEVKKRKKMDKASWEELIEACHKDNVDLRATFMHTPKDPPKPYDIWGLNLVEVEVDCLTGEHKIIRADLLQDAGKSLSPEVDIGQLEGAYIMGIGLWTKEQLIYDENNGQLLTKNTWDYKIPFPKCIPEDFRIKMISNRPNPLGVLGSKSTGEAPICLTITVVLAIRNAIASARSDAGNNDWFNMDSPVTPERIVDLCLTDPSQFNF